MYRAGPTGGGLPLPRARLGVFTAAIGVLGVLAVLVPVVLLFSGGPGNGWRTFREGGPGMWLLLLLDFALPVALGVSAAFVVRGKRAPAGLFFGVAVIPLLAATLFAYLALRQLVGAVGSGLVEPGTMMRINAAGTSEALALDMFGGFITCGNAILGSVALASVVGSIDVAKAARSDAPPPSSVFGAATVVSGVAWFVGTLIVTALRLRTVGLAAVCVVLVVAVLVPFAVFAARAAPVLRGWHDAIEARRAASALLVAGLCAVLAVIVLERSLEARVGAVVFGAVSGDSIDPSQRARILMELADARRWSAIAVAVHGVLGTVTFALALAGTIGPSRYPVSPSTVIAGSVGVFVLAAVFGLGAARTRATELIAASGKRTVPKGITLPVVDASMDEGRTGYDGTLVIRADGTDEPGTKLPADVCSRRAVVNVYADRMATLEALSKRLPSEPCSSVELLFAAAMENDRPAAAKLGDLAAFIGPDVASIRLFYDPSPRVPSTKGYAGNVLNVRALADEIIEYEGEQTKLPLGTSTPNLRGHAYDHVHYVFRPTDTVGRVVRVMAAMKERFGSRLLYGPPSTLHIDWSDRPQPRR